MPRVCRSSFILQVVSRRLQDHQYPSQFWSVSSFSSLPESATGRARKRRSRVAKRNPTTKNKAREEEEVLPYPKGKPWRVLWPNPHDDPPDSPNQQEVKQRMIPRRADFQNAWKMYKTTWEDGLRGIPEEISADKNTNPSDQHHDNEQFKTDSSWESTRDNVSRNFDVAQKEAQQFAEEVKEQTGIRTQEDLRNLASSIMKLATESLKEFMAGYRQGRDEEVDKMLHEYFQDTVDGDNDQGAERGEKKQRRKPKRAILRE